MSSKKRSVDNSESTTEEPLKRGAAHATKGKGEEGEVEVDEMGEFEDAWEDEIEDDEDAGEVYIEESSDDYESDESEEGEEGEGEGEHGEGANGEGMDLDPSQPTTTKPPKKEKKPKKQVTFDQDDDDQQHQPDLDANTFLPGTHHLEQGEVLVADMSTYVMLHPMGVEWPCLSFDVLRDGLGATRSSFPATMYMVAGSQADKPKDNRVYVMKLSQLHKTKEDEDEDEMSDDDDDDDLDEDPILEYKAIPHFGGINRIRRMLHPTSQIVATWSDSGKVNIIDINDAVTSLDTPGMKGEGKTLGSLKQHGGVEGFALDWSGVQHGKLLSGDCNAKIFLTTVNPSGDLSTDSTPFASHTASVEDLQWSPSEATVFASCSVDTSIRIWDTRTRKKSQLTVSKAHESDINAISWNKSVDYLLASGADDGSFSVWDMRTFVSSSSQQSGRGKPTPAASFKWHKEQVTSIEWHPFEDSMLAVSGADDQVTLWDLAVERDPEEEKELLGGRTGQQALGGVDVPPQLMFIHQGQTHLKEVHWHPQIPGVLISTAGDGFNIFKTINS